MHRYRLPDGAEAQFQPGSHRRVLANRLGIIRKRDMDQAEYEALVQVQERYLHIITSDTRFTAVLLRKMHRDWLGGIYEWAGDYRTVDMEKGGFRWPPAKLVEQNVACFDADILTRHTPCKPGKLPEVGRGIAVVHAEFLLIHPFREGNGRLARWLASLMALQAGLPTPDYRFEGRGSRAEKVRYLDAVTRGYVRDYRPLADFFVETLARRLEHDG
ncbi:MAG: Fic family protein [Armatimonadetes bacterium]|nr:Fic family protein [Armatimonadota bacterium]